MCVFVCVWTSRSLRAKDSVSAQHKTHSSATSEWVLISEKTSSSGMEKKYWIQQFANETNLQWRLCRLRGTSEWPAGGAGWSWRIIWFCRAVELWHMDFLTHCRWLERWSLSHCTRDFVFQLFCIQEIQCVTHKLCATLNKLYSCVCLGVEVRGSVICPKAGVFH